MAKSGGTQVKSESGISGSSEISNLLTVIRAYVPGLQHRKVLLLLRLSLVRAELWSSIQTHELPQSVRPDSLSGKCHQAKQRAPPSPWTTRHVKGDVFFSEFECTSLQRPASDPNLDGEHTGLATAKWDSVDKPSKGPQMAVNNWPWASVLEEANLANPNDPGGPTLLICRTSEISHANKLAPSAMSGFLPTCMPCFAHWSFF
jgi:hypothetical protein